MGFKGYEVGVNLGGWISQYKEFATKHFEEFITESDIAKIASWGMDHVRLPVDYPVLEDDKKPFEYLQRGFAYLDNCLSWCKKYNLNLIIDVHKAQGYSFTTLDANSLFEDETTQKRFISLWVAIAKRYENEGDNVTFELLNEMVEPDSSRWNDLAHRTIKAIREISEQRYIIYGGNYYNSVHELKNIDVLENDKRIVYTFHHYLPMMITHLAAPWVPGMVEYNQLHKVEYPCDSYEGVDEFLQKYPEWEYPIREYTENPCNRDYIHRTLKDARDFAEKTGRQVYCGEFGVILYASDSSRQKAVGRLYRRTR